MMSTSIYFFHFSSRINLDLYNKIKWSETKLFESLYVALFGIWHSGLTMEEAVTKFYNLLYALRDEFIPFKKGTMGSKYPLWYSLSLIKMIKEKHKYHKKYLRYKNYSDHLSFITLRNREKNLEKECYKNYIQRVQNNIKSNPKAFWAYIKSRDETDIR